MLPKVRWSTKRSSRPSESRNRIRRCGSSGAPAGCTKTWPDITFEDAYAISTEVANLKIAAGAKLIGHKVGLTSKAMQRSSQIDEPDYGHLLDYMMIADGAKVPHENFCLPRVEVELAFPEDDRRSLVDRRA